MRKNGFEILEISPLRLADPHYLRTIRPQLRKEARMKSDEILRFLDLVVLARRA